MSVCLVVRPSFCVSITEVCSQTVWPILYLEVKTSLYNYANLMFKYFAKKLFFNCLKVKNTSFLISQDSDYFTTWVGVWLLGMVVKSRLNHEIKYFFIPRPNMLSADIFRIKDYQQTVRLAHRKQSPFLMPKKINW